MSNQPFAHDDVHPTTRPVGAILGTTVPSVERSALALNDIAVFACVAEEKSLTRAARRLGLPKSTVSRKIAALEERLGLRLLHRTTRRVDVTDAGQSLHDEARDALAALAVAADRVADRGNALRGRIRVSAPNDFGVAVCSPLFCAFAHTHPEITLETVFTDRKVDLVQEGFDLAIRLGDVRDASLVARMVGTIQGHLAASARYVERHGLPRTPDDLARHRVIEFSPSGLFSGSMRLFDPAGAPVDVFFESHMRVNSLLHARDAVLSDLGVARIPTYLSAKLLAAKEIVHVLPGYWTAERPVRIVHTGRLVSARVRLFLDYLGGALRPAQAGASGTARSKRRASKP